VGGGDPEVGILHSFSQRTPRLCGGSFMFASLMPKNSLTQMNMDEHRLKSHEKLSASTSVDLCRRKSRTNILLFLVLTIITLITYLQVSRFEFVAYDDDSYVYQNPHIRGGLGLAGVKWAFETFHSANWHPLTWVSHMMDVELFGLDAGKHHLVNLIIHILNTLLVFITFNRMTGRTWENAFIAACFALHPLHVESVAWVSERKDLLCCLFWMLTLLAYSRYTENEDPKRYAVCLLTFSLSLMSKPMSVSLPFILLLLDYWPLRRMVFAKPEHEKDSRNPPGAPGTPMTLVLEKIPFFMLSLLSCIVTLLAQSKSGAVQTLDSISFSHRIYNAIAAYTQYLYKTFWPFNLQVIYPLSDHFQIRGIILSVVFLIVILAFSIYFRRRNPYLLVGLLWYLGTLIPVSGLVQVGLQAMADRYTYIPMIGVILAVSYGISDCLRNSARHRVAITILCSAFIIFIAVLSFKQIQYWRNTESLFGYAIDVDPDNWVALMNLGNYYAAKGEQSQALQLLDRTLELKPDRSDVYNNIGLVYNNTKEYPKAETYIRKGLAIDKGNDANGTAEMYNNLGVALANQGRFDEAIASYNQALKLRGDYPEALSNLGGAYVAVNEPRKAIELFSEAVSADNRSVQAYYGLIMTYQKLGEKQEAYEALKRLEQYDPRLAEALKPAFGR
jgi:tetratricopeptide (TPR) repeat protein